MEAKLPQQISKPRTHVSAQCGGSSFLDVASRVYNAVAPHSKEPLPFEQIVNDATTPGMVDRKLVDKTKTELYRMSGTNLTEQEVRAAYDQALDEVTEQRRRIVAVKHHEFAWRCTAISCIVEYLAYQADSEVFKIIEETDIADKDTLTQERQDARDYIDKYVERVCEAIDSSEDLMCDFRVKLSKLFKRKLTAAKNAIAKQAKQLGVEKHIDAVSSIALTMKFIEIQHQCHKMISNSEWYSYVRKNTPIERGITFSELAYKHYGIVLGILDPNEHEKPKPNKTIDKLFNDLIKMLMDTKLYVSAVNYALKENKDE